MSKLSFRSRQLDVNKHILIYRHEEFGKISDFTKSSRSVAPIPSGMEKEEESEYHLQQAIQSQKVTVKGVVIPTPSVESGTDYDLFYKGNFPLPKQFIHIQPFDLEDNLPEYDMDSEDEEWLNIVNSNNRNGNTENAKTAKNVAKTNGLPETTLITPDVFERLMDTFEKASGHQMISYDEAKVMIKNENEDVLRNIYVYWHKKRFIKGMNLTPQILTEKRIMAIPPTQSLSQQLSNINSSITASITSTTMGQTKQNGKPLITHVLSAAEKKLSITANTSSINQHDNSNPATNPYIAFRRRAEKMQTRKNRKNDEYSYEKMLKLKRDLIRAQKIFELVEKRESFKTDLVNIAQNTFKTRFALQDFSGDTYRETKRLYNTTNNNNMLYEESPISPLKNYSYPYGLDSYYYTNNAYSAIQNTSPFKEQFEWGLDFKKRTLSPTKAMSSSTTNKRQSNSLRKQNKNHDYLGVLEDERHNIQNRSFSISSTSQHPRSKRQGAHPPLRYTRDYDSSSLASSTSNIHSEIHYNNTNNHNANNKRKILTTLMKTSSSNASHNQQQDPYYYYYYHPGGGYSGNQHLENNDDEFYPSSLTMTHNKKRKITSSMITPTPSQILPHNKRMRKGSGETDQQYYNNTKIKVSSSPYASPTTNKTIIPPPYNTVDGIVGALRKAMYLNPYPMNGETTNPLILLLQLERLKRIKLAFYKLNNTPKAKMEDDNKTTTLIENHYSPTMAKSRIRKLFMALHIPHVSRENSPTETPVVHDAIAKTTLENPISTAIAVVGDHKLISSDYDRRIRVFFAALERALYQNMYSQSTSTNDGTSGKNVEKNDDIFKNDHYKVAHRLYPHIYYTYSWLDYFYGTFHDTHLTTAIIHTPFTYSPAISRKTKTAKQNDQHQNNQNKGLFVTNTSLNYSNLHNIPSMFDVNVPPKRLIAPSSIVDMMGRVKSNIPKRLKHTPTCLRTYFKRNTQLHLSKMLSNTSSYQSQQPTTSQLLQNSPALLNIGSGGTKVCLPLSTPLQYHNNPQINHANDNNINNYAYLGNDNISFAIPHNYHTLYNSNTTTSHPQTKHVINASIPNSGLHNTSHKMLGNILVPRSLSLTTTPSNLHTIYNNNTSSLNNNNGTNNNFVYYSESLSKQQQQQYIMHPSNMTNSSAGYYSYNLTNNNPVLKSMFESPAPMSATTIYLNQNGSTINSVGLTTPTYATVNSDTITPTNIHNNNGNRYFSVNNRSTFNTTLSNLSFATTYPINSQNVNATGLYGSSYQLGATNLTTASQLHNTQNSTPNVALRGIFSSQSTNMPAPSTISQSQFLPQQFLLIKQSLASGTSNLSNNSLIVQQQQHYPHQLTTKSHIQLLANADSPAIPVNYNVNTSTYFFAAHNLNAAANAANNPSSSSSIRHKVNNTAGLPPATSNKRPLGANESGQPQQQISQLQRIIPSTSTSQYMVLNVADLSNIKYISVSGSQSPSFIIVTDNSSHTLSTTTSTTPSIKLAPHPQQILGVGNANFNSSTNNHHLSNLMQVKLGTNNQILNVAPPSNNHSMAPSEATVTLIGDYILLPPQTQYSTFNSYNRNLQKSVQNVYMTSSSSHNSTISSSLLGSHSHLESAICNTAFNNTGNIGGNSVNNNSTYMLITNNQISPINFNNNNKSHTPSITSLSANKYYNNTLLTQINKSLHHEVETRDVQTLNRIHISNIATNNVNVNNTNQITVTSSITHNIINNLATNNLFKLVSISNNNANNSPNLNTANHLIQNVNHINSGGAKSLTPIVMATQHHQSNTYIAGSAVGNINLLRPSPGNVHAKQQIINPININLTSLSNNNNNFIVINREGLSKLNVNNNNNPGGVNKTLNLLGNGGIGINQQYSSNKFFVSGTSILTNYKENQTLSPIILPMTTTNSSGLTNTPSMNSILANRNASSLHMANTSTKLSNASLIANNATIYNTNNLNQKYKTLSLLIPSTTNTNLNSNNAPNKNIVLSHSTNVQSIGGPPIVGASTPQKYTVILQQPHQTPVNAQPTASEFSMVSLPSSLNKSQNVVVATPTTNCGNSGSVGPSPTPTTTSSFSPTIVNLFAIT